MNKTIIPVLAAAVLALSLLASPEARAVQYVQNGSGVCKSALPVFDGKIRNRPTAISNEGTSSAFVSCSALDRLDGSSDIAGVWIHNNSAAALDVTCTFVSGNAVTTPHLFTKTQNFAPGTGNYILWSAATDNGGDPFGSFVNFSCNLPAGVELRLVTYNETANL